MSRRVCFAVASACLLVVLPAADTVATAVYSRVGNNYKRERVKSGSFKSEYYAMANGGRIAGTTGDRTVDRVTYAEVAEISMRLLSQQNYHYAQTKEQAKLLIMLQWGNTIAPNGTKYEHDVGHAGRAMEDLRWFLQENGMDRSQIDAQLSGGDPLAQGDGGVIGDMKARFEMTMLQVLSNNRLRDRINESNARVLGYMDDLADTNDIRRWAGGGDRFTDLITDVEESRYYIVITAYDFRELTERNEKKLLWQTRVSVRSPGNRFDDSYVAMLKGASKYFGQNSGRLIRGEESKGTVELGDLKFLGEAKEPVAAESKTKK